MATNDVREVNPVEHPDQAQGGAAISAPRTSFRSNRQVDLKEIPTVPFAWVDEHVYAAIRGCSVKVVQRDRQLGIGCRYKKINGRTVRYKIADIMAFLESQPGGDGVTERQKPRRGRPRKAA